MDTVPSRDRDWTNLAYIDRSSMRCSAAASTSMEVLFISMDYPPLPLVAEGSRFPGLGARSRARARVISVLEHARGCSPSRGASWQSRISRRPASGANTASSLSLALL